jgi:hypothetical protein
MHSASLLYKTVQGRRELAYGDSSRPGESVIKSLDKSVSDCKLNLRLVRGKVSLFHHSDVQLELKA